MKMFRSTEWCAELRGLAQNRGGGVVCFLGKSNQGGARKQKILSNRCDVDKSIGCI